MYEFAHRLPELRTEWGPTFGRFIILGHFARSCATFDAVRVPVPCGCRFSGPALPVHAWFKAFYSPGVFRKVLLERGCGVAGILEFTAQSLNVSTSGFQTGRTHPGPIGAWRTPRLLGECG